MSLALAIRDSPPDELTPSFYNQAGWAIKGQLMAHLGHMLDRMPLRC